jgi:hypothetical protein
MPSSLGSKLNLSSGKEMRLSEQQNYPKAVPAYSFAAIASERASARRLVFLQSQRDYIAKSVR